jgi:hypothetical protein
MVEQAWLDDDDIIVKESVFNDMISKKKVKEAIEKVFNPNKEIVDEEGVVVCGTYEELLLKELELI